MTLPKPVSPSARTLRVLLDHMRDCPTCRNETRPPGHPAAFCAIGRSLFELRKAWLRLEAAEARGREAAHLSRLNT